MIDLWKVKRMVSVTLERTDNGLPRLRFRTPPAYSQSVTSDADGTGFKYLYFAVVPLLAG